MKNGIVLSRKFTDLAKTTRDITGDTREDFLEFWRGASGETIFVPVTDYIAFRGIPIASYDNQYRVSGKDWSRVYRELAYTLYDGAEKDGETVIKKCHYGILLFELQFLIDFFDEAKKIVLDRENQKSCGFTTD